jgi:CheY-like chemotaxis protein
LDQFQCSYELAQSADDALQQLERNITDKNSWKYDVIFVDYVMPNKDGIALVKEIREKTAFAGLISS